MMFGLAVMLLGLAACGPAPTPAAPTSAPTPSLGSRTTPSAPAPAAANWDQIVAAARQEGSVVVSGPPGELWRRALGAFDEAYPGIKIQYTGSDSRNFWPKLEQERAGGIYTWDLRVGGPDPQVFAARDRGTLDPVKQLLVLPEVVDESVWSGGASGLYADRDKTFLPAFVAQADFSTWVNRGVVPIADLSSDTQLIDPRWKGKLSIQDPRGGAGLGTLTTMLVKYGEPFVRDLLSKQDIVVSGDNRQLTEWLIRNRYPIAVGLSDQDLVEFRSQGLNADVQGLGTPSKLSLGFGGIQLISQRPHPSAAQVFINWLLTRAAQEKIVSITQTNSRRLDVPVVTPSKAIDAARLAEYVPHQYEEYLVARTRAQHIAEELLK
jgi:iron(III) transport system substrate-binding protein